MSLNNAKTYASLYNVHLTVFEASYGNPCILNESTFKSAIYSGKPSILGCQSMSNLSTFHAIVLKGYSSVAWFVWNPQFNFFESTPINTVSSSTGTATRYTDPYGKKYEVYGYAL